MKRQRLLAVLAILVGVTALAASAAISQQPKTHRLVIHISENNPTTMNIALNNAQNAIAVFQERGDKVEVEFVAIGPGLNMLRDDTSPVKARIAGIAASNSNITFSGCGNTRAGMQKSEGKEIPMLPQARIVPAGIVRVVELEEQGWTYVRP